LVRSVCVLGGGGLIVHFLQRERRDEAETAIGGLAVGRSARHTPVGVVGAFLHRKGNQSVGADQTANDFDLAAGKLAIPQPAGLRYLHASM